MVKPQDMVILNWINRHGFAAATQIAAEFKMNNHTVYYRLRQLLAAGLLCHEKIMHGKPGVYWLTSAGAKACASLLSPIKRPVLHKLEHDLNLVSLARQLQDRYLDVQWVTTREIMSERLSSLGMLKNLGCPPPPQIPDGLLYKDGLTFAVELELTAKAEHRLSGIITNYTAAIISGRYVAVFYFCGSEAIMRRIDMLTAKSTAATLFQTFLYQQDSL